MKKNEKKVESGNNRRDFLSKVIPAGVLFCTGCPKVFANDPKGKEDNPTSMSGMSYVEAFNFAFRDNYIPQTIALAEKLGRKKLLGILKETASAAFSTDSFIENYRNDYDQTFWGSVLQQEVIEDSEDAHELKTTKCLYAKIFKEANAADIGYASLCHADFANAEARGKKLVRTKTLMQGHDCCNHRWVDLK